MARALKVYRTAIGFHDAYVAAPSKKAALAAWGADKDLFAIGAAELVTDPALTQAALAQPGEVVKVSRGSLAEHLREAVRNAKPGSSPRQRPSPAGGPATAPSGRKTKPPPPPSRRRVDEAEEALARFEASAEAEVAALREREATLARERAALEAAQDKGRERLRARVTRAREQHDRALQRWRDTA